MKNTTSRILQELTHARNQVVQDRIEFLTRGRHAHDVEHMRALFEPLRELFGLARQVGGELQFSLCFAELTFLVDHARANAGDAREQAIDRLTDGTDFVGTQVADACEIVVLIGSVDYFDKVCQAGAQQALGDPGRERPEAGTTAKAPARNLREGSSGMRAIRPSHQTTAVARATLPATMMPV